MYQPHWGLREAPFRGGLLPAYLLTSASYDEAQARLQFLVEQQRRVGLLLGVGGVGKSLLLGQFFRLMTEAGQEPVRLSLLGVSGPEFVWLAAAAVGIRLEGEVSAYRLWRALADRLAENRYQQIPTIVLLDDADAASPDVLDQAVRWTQLDASPGPGVTLIAAADPRRVGRLGSRLLELAELRVDLDPWEPQETSAYVRGALAAAGGSGDEFQEEALARLHELTGGVPRQVQQLGDLALVAGAGRRLRQIDAETVSTACYELGLVSTAAR